MRKIIGLAIALAATNASLYCWKSAETKGEQPTFFGKLTTQEDNTVYITNITIGKSATEQEKIVLYEKPKNMVPTDLGYILPGNPYKDLSATTMELSKVKKIEVPDPEITWKWSNKEGQRLTKTTIEFIEVAITWRSGITTHYLLELGTENSRRSVKLFCDVIDKVVDSTKKDDGLLCPGVKKSDVHTTGAPFQSIKLVEIEEPCYKIPDNAGTLKAETNGSLL